MSKTSMIRARTEPGLKAEVESIFRALGITCSEAINMFFSQVRLRKGIPFNVELPNATTLRAIQDIKKKRGLKTAKDAETLFKQLGIYSGPANLDQKPRLS